MAATKTAKSETGTKVKETAEAKGISDERIDKVNYKLESLPYCCGVAEFGGMDGKVDAEAALMAALHHQKRGYVIATTTSNQKAGAKSLEKAGFKALAVFTNPVHKRDTTITLWGKKTPVSAKKHECKKGTSYGFYDWDD